MLKKFGGFVVVSAFCFLSACGTTSTGGNQVIADASRNPGGWVSAIMSQYKNEFQLGKTSKESILAVFGQPQADTDLSAGGKTFNELIYTAVTSSVTGMDAAKSFVESDSAVAAGALKKAPKDIGKTLEFIFPVGGHTLVGFQCAEGFGSEQRQVCGQSDAEILQKLH